MIGERVRKLRESHNILLRQLAAKLDMDTAMLSKMERGDRFFRKEDIFLLAEIFKKPEEELLTLWLADKIIELIKNEPQATDALKMALKEIKKL
jgi:HTH-type transcriptional regulator, competence development regulator